MKQLRQNTTWTTREGQVVAIADMDITHAANTYRMLLRKADQIIQAEAASLSVLRPAVSAEVATSLVERELSMMHKDPQQYLANTPLLRALGLRAGLITETPMSREEAAYYSSRANYEYQIEQRHQESLAAQIEDYRRRKTLVASGQSA